MASFFPAAILCQYAWVRLDAVLSAQFANAAVTSIAASALAAALASLIALFIAYCGRHLTQHLARALVTLAGLGYAYPGTILALGLLIPLAALDRSIGGLIFTGTSFALILAYVLRFLSISLNGIEAGLGRITPSLNAVARTLGRSEFAVFREVELPMLRPAIAAALLLVFVDCMKELPATLILRPFGFETLATLVYTMASLDQLEDASPAALSIVLVGLLPVLILARGMERPRLEIKYEKPSYTKALLIVPASASLTPLRACN